MTHPDDDLLSAILDGESPTTDHVRSCPTCARRLDALDRARALVAEPPPAPPTVQREAAIATAVDHAGAPAAEATILRPAGGRWARPGRTWTLAAAAAVVALLVAVPLLGRVDLGGDTGDETATGTGADSGAESFAAGPIDGGHLGELDPDSNLADLVRAAIGPEPAAGEGPAADAREQDGAGGSGAATEAAPEPDTTALRSAPLAGGNCADAPRDGDPDLGPLRFVATATWDGRPAAVYAYDLDGAGGLTTRVYVLAQAGCETLNVQSFS